uniref:NADH dehydrogenase subunit 2 n=1 Tax=Pycnogonum diceros TaxID=373309 RepID=UPI00226C7A35|nr:NADH dehydrogenase subunit 2 [Pycnogonum diceros]UZA61222.1 NADH dehydrogenase subunit 2 [Pycnogonum diceros]
MNILLFMILMSITMAISSNSWFSIWISLEMNTMLFIMMLLNKKNQQFIESAMKYFLIQTISSIILIFSSFYMNDNYLNKMMLIMMISMIMKMGMFPFHFWYIEVLPKMKWMNVFMMMTLQKIIPMMLMMYIMKKINLTMMFSLIMINVIISSINMMNQTNMKKIMGFSSMNQMGWMVMSMMMNTMTWVMFMIIYLMINFTVLNYFMKMKIYKLNQMMMMSSMMMSVTILSMAGLPPFSGFMIKWIIIQQMMMKSMIIMSLIMIFSSVVNMYIYLRMISANFMKSKMMMKWKMKNNNQNMMMMFTSTITLPIFMMMFM